MTRLKFNFRYIVNARYMRISWQLVLSIPEVWKLTADDKWLFIFALRDSDTIQIDTRYWRSILCVASSGSRCVIWLTKALKSQIRWVIWRTSRLKVELRYIVGPIRVSHIELVLGLVALVEIGIVACYTASMLGFAINKPRYNLVHFSHHGYVSIVK